MYRSEVLAIVLMLGLATFFIFASVRAIVPSQLTTHRDLFSALVCGFIALLLVAMSVLLIVPMIR